MSNETEKKSRRVGGGEIGEDFRARSRQANGQESRALPHKENCRDKADAKSSGGPLRDVVTLECDCFIWKSWLLTWEPASVFALSSDWDSSSGGFQKEFMSWQSWTSFWWTHLSSSSSPKRSLSLSPGLPMFRFTRTQCQMHLALPRYILGTVWISLLSWFKGKHQWIFPWWSCQGQKRNIHMDVLGDVTFPIVFLLYFPFLELFIHLSLSVSSSSFLLTPSEAAMRFLPTPCFSHRQRFECFVEQSCRSSWLALFSFQSL